MSDLPDSVTTMIDKEELLRLLEEYFVAEVESNEDTWDETHYYDDETVGFDKGWQSGFSYAIYLIKENW